MQGGGLRSGPPPTHISRLVLSHLTIYMLSHFWTLISVYRGCVLDLTPDILWFLYEDVVPYSVFHFYAMQYVTFGGVVVNVELLNDISILILYI